MRRTAAILAAALLTPLGAARAFRRRENKMTAAVRAAVI
jgi:hypothetical protein